MTIDEAITHCEVRAKVDCSECAEEHKQLAEWLKELRQYKDTGLDPEEILTGVQLAEIACLQIRYKKRQELLERAAECIENCYGRETELSEAIRKEIN